MQLEESKEEIAEAEAKVADYEQAIDELEREQRLELERISLENERKLVAANAKASSPFAISDATDSF